MTDLIHQIIEIAKNIAHMFDANLLEPLTAIAKAIGTLFVKVLELAIMAVRWVFSNI